MTPILFFNLVMGIIGSFQTFTAAYVMTQGGPNHATLFYILYLYQNAFQNFQARSFRNSGVRVGSRREGRYIPWLWSHMIGWLREHLPAR